MMIRIVTTISFHLKFLWKGIRFKWQKEQYNAVKIKSIIMIPYKNIKLL